MSKETKWSFKLKQDGLTVALGVGFDKDFVVSEAEHYLLQYLDEDYSKMTLELKKNVHFRKCLETGEIKNEKIAK